MNRVLVVLFCLHMNAASAKGLFESIGEGLDSVVSTVGSKVSEVANRASKGGENDGSKYTMENKDVNALGEVEYSENSLSVGKEVRGGNEQSVEAEPNNSYDAANTLTIGLPTEGVLYRSWGVDVDYYLFDNSDRQEMIISLEQPNFEMNEESNRFKSKKDHGGFTDFSVKVYDDTKKHKRIDWFAARKEKITHHKIMMPKGRFYIVVKGVDYSGKVGSNNSGSKYMEYTLKVSGIVDSDVSNRPSSDSIF